MTELLLALAAICQIESAEPNTQEMQRECVAEILECEANWARRMAECVRVKKPNGGE